MSRYKPEKRAHRVMQHLAKGEDTFAGLADLFLGEIRGDVRTKLHLIIRALRTDGFVDRGVFGWALTLEGFKACAKLDAGEEVETEDYPPQTSVRVFARKEAA